MRSALILFSVLLVLLLILSTLGGSIRTREMFVEVQAPPTFAPPPPSQLLPPELPALIRQEDPTALLSHQQPSMEPPAPSAPVVFEQQAMEQQAPAQVDENLSSLAIQLEGFSQDQLFAAV